MPSLSIGFMDFLRKFKTAAQVERHERHEPRWDVWPKEGGPSVGAPQDFAEQPQTLLTRSHLDERHS